MCRQHPCYDSLSPNARTAETVLRCGDCCAYITQMRYCSEIEEEDGLVFITKEAVNVVYEPIDDSLIQNFHPRNVVTKYSNTELYCEVCNAVVGQYSERLRLFPTGSTETDWCFVLDRDAIYVNTEFI